MFWGAAQLRGAASAGTMCVPETSTRKGARIHKANKKPSVEDEETPMPLLCAIMTYFR